MEMIKSLVIIVFGVLLLKNNKQKNNRNNNRNNNQNNTTKWKSPYIKELGFEKRNYGSIYRETSPYKKKENLLLTREKSFLNILQLYIDNSYYYICPKVRLADVIYVDTKYNFTKYFNKIGTKSIDFLLCDKTYMSPKIAIYLDDHNHLDEDMIQDRQYITSSLEDSGVKVVRFNINVTYNLDDIANMLNINI